MFVTDVERFWGSSLITMTDVCPAAANTRTQQTASGSRSHIPPIAMQVVARFGEWIRFSLS
jgi:hypothetical protein